MFYITRVVIRNDFNEEDADPEELDFRIETDQEKRNDILANLIEIKCYTTIIPCDIDHLNKNNCRDQIRDKLAVDILMDQDADKRHELFLMFLLNAPAEDIQYVKSQLEKELFNRY